MELGWHFFSFIQKLKIYLSNKKTKCFSIWIYSIMNKFRCRRPVDGTQIHESCWQNQRIRKYDGDHVIHHVTSVSCCSRVDASLDRLTFHGLPDRTTDRWRPCHPGTVSVGVASRCCRSVLLAVLSVGAIGRCCRRSYRNSIYGFTNAVRIDSVPREQHPSHRPTDRYPFLQPVRAPLTTPQPIDYLFFWVLYARWIFRDHVRS